MRARPRRRAMNAELAVDPAQVGPNRVSRNEQLAAILGALRLLGRYLTTRTCVSRMRVPPRLLPNATEEARVLRKICFNSRPVAPPRTPSLRVLDLVADVLDQPRLDDQLAGSSDHAQCTAAHPKLVIVGVGPGVDL